MKYAKSHSHLNTLLKRNSTTI